MESAPACSRTTSTTRRRGQPSFCRDLRRGSGSRSSPMPACPGISDPGRQLIAAALEAGVGVTVLPGRVRSRGGPRRRRVRRQTATSSSAFSRAATARSPKVWEGLAEWPWPAVAFESPRRLPATLRSLAGADPVARGGGLPRADQAGTKRSRAGGARELADRFAEPPKGEVTLVLGPAAGAGPPAPGAAVEAVAELVGAGVARRQAASVVARLTGLSRKDLYDTSL